MQLYTGLSFGCASLPSPRCCSNKIFKESLVTADSPESITSARCVVLTAFACELLPRECHLFVFSVVYAYLADGVISEASA